MQLDYLPAMLAGGLGLRKGVLVGLTKDGELVVDLGEECDYHLVCDWLQTSAEPPELAAGDEVLVMVSENADDRGCVLGRVGRFAPPRKKPTATTGATVEIKADEQLILTCGASSLVMREDGKILIRGIDIVTHAERAQRIKGGSVQIN